MRSWWAVAAVAVWSVVRAGAAEETWRIDAQLRLRAEDRNNREFDPAVDDRLTNMLQRTRVGATWRPDEAWTLRLLLQDSRTWDRRSKSPATEAELEVQEGYVRYAGLAGGKLGVTVGRQGLAYGNQRLVGTFEWSNVTRRYDALKVDWQFGGGRLDGWVAELGGSPSTFAADGEFWGLHADWPKLWGAPMQAYALWLHDPSSLTTNVVTVGGRRHQQLGPWRYDLEAALQGGDVAAYAAALEGGRKLGSFGLAAGYCLASGDSRPGAGGGGNTTFNNLFPTNHTHYGIMDYQGWRNVHNGYLKASWKPNRPWYGELQAHAFWLNVDKDFWYGAGGAPNRTSAGTPYRDATGASGNEVGQELDLVVGGKINQYLDLQAGFGHFFPGRFVSRVNRANGLATSASDFAYFQATGSY